MVQYGTKVFMFMFLLLVFGACVGTNCSNTICINGGLCVDGTCNCPTGYEGDNCETAWNEKFIGTWQVTDTLFDSTAILFSKYTIHIYGTGNGGNFYIDRLGGYSDSVIHASSDSLSANISGPSAFTFVTKYSKDSTFHLDSGTGSISSGGQVNANLRYTTRSKTYTLYSSWVKK